MAYKKLDEVTSRFMSSVNFGMLLDSSVEDRRVVDTLLNVFAIHPVLKPARYGLYEPVKEAYNRDSFEKLGSLPGSFTSLMVRGKRLCFSVQLIRDKESETWLVDFDRTIVPDDIIHEAVNRFTSEVPLTLATMHAVSEQEMKYCQTYGIGWPRVDGYHFSPFSRSELSDGIPFLPWRILSGPIYIRHFGRERLLSTPVFAVEEIASNVIALQLTNSIEDIRDDWDTLQSVRQAAMTHLGLNSFRRINPHYKSSDEPGTTYRTLPAPHFPPELASERRRSEEIRRRRSEPKRPPPASFDEMLSDPMRYRVVDLSKSKKKADSNIVIVDSNREEMVGFEDDQLRDEIVRRLIEAGVKVQRIYS